MIQLSLLMEKVLGTTWQSQNDTISFPGKAESPRNWTKRPLFQSVATLFNPLGLIVPHVIVGKIMIQDLWKKGLEWDEPTDDVLREKFPNGGEKCKSLRVSSFLDRSVLPSGGSRGGPKGPWPPPPLSGEPHFFFDAEQCAVMCARVK